MQQTSLPRESEIENQEVNTFLNSDCMRATGAVLVKKHDVSHKSIPLPFGKKHGLSLCGFDFEFCADGKILLFYDNFHIYSLFAKIHKVFVVCILSYNMHACKIQFLNAKLHETRRFPSYRRLSRSDFNSQTRFFNIGCSLLGQSSQRGSRTKARFCISICGTHKSFAEITQSS